MENTFLRRGTKQLLALQPLNKPVCRIWLWVKKKAPRDQLLADFFLYQTGLFWASFFEAKPLKNSSEVWIFLQRRWIHLSGNLNLSSFRIVVGLESTSWPLSEWLRRCDRLRKKGWLLDGLVGLGLAIWARKWFGYPKKLIQGRWFGYEEKALWSHFDLAKAVPRRMRDFWRRWTVSETQRPGGWQKIQIFPSDSWTEESFGSAHLRCHGCTMTRLCPM